MFRSISSATKIFQLPILLLFFVVWFGGSTTGLIVLFLLETWESLKICPKFWEKKQIVSERGEEETSCACPRQTRTKEIGIWQTVWGIQRKSYPDHFSWATTQKKSINAWCMSGSLVEKKTIPWWRKQKKNQVSEVIPVIAG